MEYSSQYRRLNILLLITLAVFSCKKDDSDKIPPQLEFRYPREYSVLSNVEVVRVLAQDNNGVSSVVYMAEGDTVGIEYAAPHTMLWNTTQYPDCTAANPYIILTAIAKDPSGNTAFETRTFSIFNAGVPPVAVELREPTDITKHTASLSWDVSVDHYFSQYVLYRDTITTVNASSEAIASSDARFENTFIDSGLDVSSYGLLEDASYYYRVYVHKPGLSTGSDSAATVRTMLPLPVKLVVPEAGEISKYTIALNWDQREDDVAYYRIHRGDSLTVTALDSIGLALPNQTTYTDTGLFADSLYYYNVYTIDQAGFTSPYDSASAVSVRTHALPTPVINPTPQDVAKYSATVAWGSVDQQEDSSWLELYAGLNGAVDTAGTPIMAISNGAALNYRHYPITQGTNYSYILRHRDSRGNQKWSAIVSLTTASINDVWNGALGRSELQEKREIELHWVEYDYLIEDDFESYTLTRDGAVIDSITNRTTVNYTDADLQRDMAYTYVLTISDTSGATIQVEEIFSTRDIYMANLIDIYVTEAWDFHMAWEPTAEPVGEFDYYAIYRTDDADVKFDDLDRSNLPDCVDGGNCVEAGRVAYRDPTDGDSLIFVDTSADLVRLRSYYYSVLSYDSNGEFAASNIIGDTLYIYPSPVIVEIPNDLVTSTTLGLIWTRASWGSSEADAAAFHSYQVWRNITPGEAPGEDGSTYQLLNVETDIDNTNYSDGGDGGLTNGGEYYYIIVLRDVFGLSANSEEVLGVTP